MDAELLSETFVALTARWFAAELLLADPRGELRVVAASSENPRWPDLLNEQLQTALNSRVIIEQAKGKLAERLGVDMDQAFGLLRDRARTSNRGLSDLARGFVDGTESLAGLSASKTRPRLPGDRQPRQQPPPG